MNCQLIARSIIGLAIFLATASLAFAQHGGHGGGGHRGGHGGSHGGGHYNGHYSSHGGHGGHYGGHGGHAGHYGGHGGHYGGHSGHYGGAHYGHGHGGHRSYGHFGHHYYPHFDFYLSPWYGGYGYSSYNYPYYDPSSYNYGYYSAGTVGAETAYVEQRQPGLPPRVAANPVTGSEGLSYQRQAEDAFRLGDFYRAARLANHALVEMPRDGKLLLFTAQTLFAVGDYRSSAAAIHQATALLDADQWGYVVENYQQFYRGRAYVEQMERLTKFIKENPDAAHAYFLRGYQHGFLGHQETALTSLGKAFELENRDQLAAKLIERFGGTPPAVSTPNSGTGPAAESDGHDGHDSNAQSIGSDDGHNHDHDDAETPPLPDAPNGSPAESDEPARNSEPK